MEDRGAMQLEMTKLGFALAEFYAERGSYPAELAELAPKFVAKIPKDVFNAAELHYKREGGGCLLYSVGMNGVDEGGRGMEDRKEGEMCDDLSVHLPAGN